MQEGKEAASTVPDEKEPGPVKLVLPGHEPLSHQEVVEKLDAIPAFHIVGGADRMIVPTTHGDSPPCGTWHACL